MEASCAITFFTPCILFFDDTSIVTIIEKNTQSLTIDLFKCVSHRVKKAKYLLFLFLYSLIAFVCVTPCCVCPTRKERAQCVHFFFVIQNDCSMWSLTQTHMHRQFRVKVYIYYFQITCDAWLLICTSSCSVIDMTDFK